MKHLILITLLGITLLSCLHKKDNIDAFWNWFELNKSAFENIDSTNQDEKLDLILSHLDLIAEDLTVEVSDVYNGERNLVISPEGNISKFKVVKEIIALAPNIKGWTFTAFRQPVNEDFTLRYDDVIFKPSEMLFSPVIEANKLDLIIYSKNVNNRNIDKIRKYGVIAVENILGEYDFVTKVHSLEFRDIEDAKDTSQLRPAKHLKAFVDSFFEQHSSKNGI